MENPNCDGAGPLGAGGNLILCLSCWAKENRYRYERGRETGQPENWPQEVWESAKVCKV